MILNPGKKVGELASGSATPTPGSKVDSISNNQVP